ncbi:MAG: hypothetical protein U1C74_21940, partial [Phenylobacterium sp.]|nr:hypothetical protein [Phenylobacterium sp.]
RRDAADDQHLERTLLLPGGLALGALRAFGRLRFRSPLRLFSFFATRVGARETTAADFRRPKECVALVKKRFLTVLNEHESCPAKFAAGQPLTFLFADFIQLFIWPEACSEMRRKSHRFAGPRPWTTPSS